jgi:hypothetical protein
LLRQALNIKPAQWEEEEDIQWMIPSCTYHGLTRRLT